jgi:hypothetical protein
MVKFGIASFISLAIATFWTGMSLLLHLPILCSGAVAVFTFILSFFGLSACMNSEN